MIYNQMETSMIQHSVIDPSSKVRFLAAFGKDPAKRAVAADIAQSFRSRFTDSGVMRNVDPPYEGVRLDGYDLGELRVDVDGDLIRLYAGSSFVDFTTETVGTLSLVPEAGDMALRGAALILLLNAWVMYARRDFGVEWVLGAMDVAALKLCRIADSREAGYWRLWCEDESYDLPIWGGGLVAALDLEPDMEAFDAYTAERRASKEWAAEPVRQEIWERERLCRIADNAARRKGAYKGAP